MLCRLKNENTYIMNLEGCYLYKDFYTSTPTTIASRDLRKLFSATIPYSLETLRVFNMFQDRFEDYVENEDVFYQVKGKQYSKDIVNVTFEKNFFEWVETEEGRKKHTIASKKKIRNHLYNNGFIMDGKKYVFYKRGAGKAKNGYALFIREEMKDPLILRSRLGLEFTHNEELDFTSLLAYESLISSGLDFTIDLDPHTEILLIDDIYGKSFMSKASVTREIDGEIVTKNEYLELQNCLTDGQGLLDESVFAKYKKHKKGFMLLRSDMFKCCAFNTKLQEWFAHNNVTTVIDMFGREYDASKIKLITTPNSLKFLKFAYKLGGDKAVCYKYWQDNIDTVFGVVKCDKEGNYGTYNRTTYQLLNSIPSLSYDDLMDITQIERDYVMLLKNDEAVFRNYLGGDAIASLKLENAMMEDEPLTMLENTELLSALLLINSDIQYTKKFKKLKSDLIANYVSHLKRGKIRLKDTKYTTLISNPYEMLLASIGEYKDISIMRGREVYCKFYEDGQEFCISRNPHINAGNVMYGKNVNHEEEYKWFNFTDNIVAVNFYDNDMPDRLQGCDTDSDTFLMVPHHIFVDKARYCESNFATPINKVKGSSLPRKYNMNELQKLDVTLSNNYIGKIVNMSQIINSYLNHAIFMNESQDIINELYQASSRLSSMSQIEIDKSKKVFDNISMSKELSKMRKIPYIKYVDGVDKFGAECKKMIVPTFFGNISSFNEYREFQKFHTPLDILQDVLVFGKGKGKKSKEFLDLLVKSKALEGKYQKNSANAIFGIVETCGKRINGMKLGDNKLSDKAKRTIEKRCKQDAVVALQALTPNDSTILGILKQCFGKKENDKIGFKKYSLLTLNLLFMANKKQVLKCFNSKLMDDDEVLVKVTEETNEVNIFGSTYKKISRKELEVWG